MGTEFTYSISDPEAPVVVVDDDGTNYPLQPRTQTFADEMPGYVMAQDIDDGVMRDLLESFLEQVDEVETAVLALRGRLAVSGDAEGYWLTLLGEDVGEPRAGRTDAQMVPAVQAALLINRGSGTWDQLIGLARVLFRDDEADVEVAYAGGSTGFQGVIRVLTDASALDIDAISTVFRRLVPAGVRMHLVYLPQPLDETFRTGYGSTVVGNSVVGLGDTGQTTGGKLAGVRV